MALARLASPLSAPSQALPGLECAREHTSLSLSPLPFPSSTHHLPTFAYLTGIIHLLDQFCNTDCPCQISDKQTTQPASTSSQASGASGCPNLSRLLSTQGAHFEVVSSCTYNCPPLSTITEANQSFCQHPSLLTDTFATLEAHYLSLLPVAFLLQSTIKHHHTHQFVSQPSAVLLQAAKSAAIFHHSRANS